MHRHFSIYRCVMRPSTFIPVKLICGMIVSDKNIFEKGKNALTKLFGSLDEESPVWPFAFTDYYGKEMGDNLFRKFISFEKLIEPERLAGIKLKSNELEDKFSREYHSSGRVINLDPGYITSAALIMATAKNFASRVPLQNGIYAHLELMFGKKDIRFLDWTYPDFYTTGYQKFFQKIRRIYLQQIKNL